jgi:hypothetical protein
MVLVPEDPDRPLSWKQLSPNRQRLISLLDSVHYGRIERLLIRDGQPVVIDDTRIIHTVKFGKASPARTSSEDRDFVLKRELVEFLAHLARVGNGFVLRIEIAGGQPLLLEIEEKPGQ